MAKDLESGERTAVMTHLQPTFGRFSHSQNRVLTRPSVIIEPEYFSRYLPKGRNIR